MALFILDASLFLFGPIDKLNSFESITIVRYFEHLIQYYKYSYYQTQFTSGECKKKWDCDEYSLEIKLV